MLAYWAGKVHVYREAVISKVSVTGVSYVYGFMECRPMEAWRVFWYKLWSARQYCVRWVRINGSCLRNFVPNYLGAYRLGDR